VTGQQHTFNTRGEPILSGCLTGGSRALPTGDHLPCACLGRGFLNRIAIELRRAEPFPGAAHLPHIARPDG
jgi:hypothetical protein